MILFRPEHVAPILDGRKTQTRRIWKRCRVRVGAIHRLYTRPPFARVDPGKSFASVRITAARQETVGDISAEDVRREGYISRAEYIAALARITQVDARQVERMHCWVVDFEIVEPSPEEHKS